MRLITSSRDKDVGQPHRVQEAGMIYVKSVAAGIATVVVAMLLSAFLVALYLFIVYKPKENESIGLDPISFAKTPLAWLIVAVIFMVGFVWEFRRAAE